MSDAATEAELRELFSMDEDDSLSDVVAVCDGEWRREGSTWFFWPHEGPEPSVLVRGLVRLALTTTTPAELAHFDSVKAGAELLRALK
jgi:hypothetical protein